jgi:FecR protein
MHIRGLCVAVIAALSANLASVAAFAQAPIGDASSVQNDVQASLNRRPLPISTGGSVFQNEHLRTGEASEAKLVFLDSTDFSLGPTSEATLDRFIYNPDRGTGRVEIEANRGVFRFVTGTQDKKDYQVVTPSGTIRVKGTEFQLLVAKDYIIVALESGALSITTNKGRVVALDQPGTSLTVHTNGRVEGPRPFSGTITKYADAQFPYFVSGLPPAINVVTDLTNWTGCYVGAQIGGSVGSGSYDNTYSDSSSLAAYSTSDASSTRGGFTAGGLSGCGYQLGPVAIGGEAEYGYDGQSSNETISGGEYTQYYLGYPPPCTGGTGGPSGCHRTLLSTPSGPEHTLSQVFNVTGVGRARVTVGYAVLPNFLFYVAGGLTLASTNTSLGGAVTMSSRSVLYSGSLISASNNKLVSGGNAGFGGEYAFTRNLIARVEYIYDRLTPSYNYSFVTGAVTGASKTSVKANENTVRAALLFKF